MPNIVTISHFSKSNDLNIPLSVSVPVSNTAIASPSNEDYLTNLITRIEKEVLLNALGLATYNTLQLALADIDNPLYASYKLLVNGDEYDSKVWQGLAYDYSLIAYKVFEEFITETSTRLSAIGNIEVRPEGATILTPMYKVANANANFIKQYQNGYLLTPIVYDNGLFIDWFGNNDSIYVSLFQYLTDKKADFTDWDEEKFRPFGDTKNSFGI